MIRKTLYATVILVVILSGAVVGVQAQEQPQPEAVDNTTAQQLPEQAQQRVEAVSDDVYIARHSWDEDEQAVADEAALAEHLRENAGAFSVLADKVVEALPGTNEGSRDLPLPSVLLSRSRPNHQQ